MALAHTPDARMRQREVAVNDYGPCEVLDPEFDDLDQWTEKEIWSLRPIETTNESIGFSYATSKGASKDRRSRQGDAE